MAITKAELVARAGDAGQSRKKTSTNTPYQADTLKYGKQFGLMEEPWLEPATIKVPRPAEVELAAGDPLSDKEWDKGVVRALYDFLPDKYGQLLEHEPDFSRQVRMQSDTCATKTERGFNMKQLCLQATAGRTNAVHLVMQHLSSILDLPVLACTEKDARGTHPEIQCLLKFPGQAKYPLFPPAVYPEGKKNPQLVFRTDEIAMVSSFLKPDTIYAANPSFPFLFKIMRLILFGPKSLKGKTLGGETLGKKWGVKKITAGFIAIAVILVSH